ncbi:XRE family transcriptional regulator [Mesorhizobium sp. SP-1A]|uniref:helix-turn-helix domain-containing protein n=1 Tax=Mesorhizobium sp. SP-1A TaxID=3077840 RepID=UPI0028F6C38B|nr:XRE family transcriptional regulator [Mesorhizobium sp. SP-1A]
MPYDNRQSLLHSAIGQKIRFYRMMRGATAMNLAAEAGISTGMLSKIERGSISPSLGTLQSLSTALGLPMSVLFQNCEKRSRAVFTSGGGMEGWPCQNKLKASHRLLGGGSGVLGVTLNPYHITLTQPSDNLPEFEHQSMEFLHVLKGELVYGHGDKHYHMAAGDSLFFHARVPHGPIELVSLPVHLLAVVCHHQNAAS